MWRTVGCNVHTQLLKQSSNCTLRTPCQHYLLKTQVNTQTLWQTCFHRTAIDPLIHKNGAGSLSAFLLRSNVDRKSLFCLLRGRWQRHMHTSTRRAASEKLLPFEIDSNVPRNVLIFTYRNDKFYRMLSILGIVQLLFWLNIGWFSYTTPKLADPEGKSAFKEDSWWAMIANMQTKFKKPMAAGCVILGGSILFFTWMFPQRTIQKLVLLQGGRNLEITTYSHMGSSRTFITPLRHVSAQQTRGKSKVTMSLKLKNKSFYYLMDMRDGKFHDVELFDYAIGLKRGEKGKFK